MSLQIGICSFSFHRLLAAGKQDIFKYISDCKELGCTQLDPWNAHLSVIRSGDAVLHAGRNPSQSQHLTAADEDYVEKVRQAAISARLPWGTIAVDGAHIYEPTAGKRDANRARAYRWIDVAAKLGAKQVRIDAGGPEDLPNESFQIIKEGYNDLIPRAKAKGIEVLFENHFGPTVIPDNCVKLLENIEGLGFLLDTHNWKPPLRDEGRRKLAKYATASHVKTLNWDANGNEVGENVEEAVQLLKDAGYTGVWGIESVPRDGDEIEGCRKTIALLKRLVP
jgi:sugar phosphate isomerase/epimerase